MKTVFSLIDVFTGCCCFFQKIGNDAASNSGYDKKPVFFQAPVPCDYRFAREGVDLLGKSSFSP